jgi:hypothetical protein
MWPGVNLDGSPEIICNLFGLQNDIRAKAINLVILEKNAQIEDLGNSNSWKFQKLFKGENGPESDYPCVFGPELYSGNVGQSTHSSSTLSVKTVPA